MKKNWEKLVRVLKISFIVAAGVAAGCFLPASAYRDTTSTIASFAGIIVAALVPTMILAATILSPMVKGKNEFNRLRGAIDQLISFFSGLFLWTLTLGFILIFGSLLQWVEIYIPIKFHVGEVSYAFKMPLTRIIGGISVSLILLILMQMIGFIHGVRVLFKIHAENIEKEINQILKEQARAASKASMPKDPRSGIGENIGILK